MTILFPILSLLFLSIYLGTFCYFIYGFVKTKETKEVLAPVPISVLIPFRNEEVNLKNLVHSFISLNYNLNITEFIFIDDNSTDNSYEVVSKELKNTNLIYKIIRQPDSKQGKKKAIITGVQNAKNNWIVTTDADSIPNKNWLNQFSISFQESNQFVIGPVINKTSKKLLGSLQNIEALLLAGTSIGSASNKNPLICSGANLGYSKELFEEVKPYEDNIHLSSGDDLFFLDKVLLTNKKVGYLKSINSIVYTESPESYKEILSQAIRWSSKNKNLKSKLNFYLSILIFGTNILFLASLITFCFGEQFSLIFICIKFSIDFIFLTVIANYYNQQKLILLAPFIYLLYPIHLLIIFVSSFFISVKWKERTIVRNEK